MQVRIVMELIGDDGEEIGREIIADMTKITTGAEDLGLSLAEGKALLAGLQQKMVETQVNLWLAENRETDGRRLRHKGYYPVTFHTLFGDVRLRSPRYALPESEGRNGPGTVSPLRQLIPDHIAPERLYLETRWASLVPYAAAAELLADVLPIDCGINATTVRQHALKTAARIERELTEERVSFMQDSCPQDWTNLPIPDGRIVIGLDGGYIRDRDDRKKNFELIVGRSLPDDGDPRYIGFVHGYDRSRSGALVVDLSAVEYLDSAGVNVLFPYVEHIRVIAHPFLVRLLDISGFSKLASVQAAPPPDER